jgi:hypothetical protein
MGLVGVSVAARRHWAQGLLRVAATRVSRLMAAYPGHEVRTFMNGEIKHGDGCLVAA